MFGVETAGLVVLFIICLYLAYKGIILLSRYLLIVFISALFPVALIKFFGVNLPLTIGTILAFVYLGVISYTIYLGLSVIEVIGKSAVKLLGLKEKKKGKGGRLIFLLYYSRLLEL
ncbi:MAG: hypothetical protein KAU95_04390 [Candidatus Aenigmarchaeota archaeon]|nr:hypothetical protein [Candidatus Aenigmarchaeota archaeon]